MKHWIYERQNVFMIWTIGPWCCWWHWAVQLLMPPPLLLLFRTDDTDIVIISIVEWRGWWRLFPIKMSPKTAAPSNENEKNALTWQLNAADKFYEWHLLCKYKSGGKWEREHSCRSPLFFLPTFSEFQPAAVRCWNTQQIFTIFCG